MKARREAIRDKLAAKRAEPDAEALKALVGLVMGIPARDEKMVEGYVHFFLMQHPELAKAYTARQLIDRVAHGFTGFIAEVADYALVVDRNPRRPL